MDLQQFEYGPPTSRPPRRCNLARTVLSGLLQALFFGCDLAFAHEILECGKSNEGERSPGEQDAKVLSKVVLGVEDDGADNLRHVVDGESEAILVEPDL